MKRVFSIALMLLLVMEVNGQRREDELPVALVKILELLPEESDESQIDDLISYYKYLLNYPLDLNKADRDDLEKLVILNTFQIESVLDYRKEYGAIFSIYELSLISGFNEKILEELKPFIKVEDGVQPSFISLSSLLNNSKSEILLRSKKLLCTQKGYSPIDEKEYQKNPESRYVSSPLYLNLQYKYYHTDRITAGFTLEKDPGEFIFLKKAKYGFDFLSTFIELKGRGLLDKIIVGDFNARFGQGLVLWNSFNSVSMSMIPSKVRASEFGFTPNRSVGENGFLSGVALSLVHKDFKANIALSAKRLDAKIEEEKFKTIYSSGEHNTIGTITNMKNLSQYLVAMNFSHSANNYKIGSTFCTYRYNYEDGKSYEDYNKFEKFKGWFGNIGIDAFVVFGKVRTFAEFSLDYRGSQAFILGLSNFYNNSIEYSLLYRFYSKNFLSLFSGAYSLNSNPNNENGVKFSISYRNSRGVVFRNVFDLAYFANKRYKVDGPSYAISYIGEANLSKSETSVYYLRLTYKRRLYNYKDISENKLFITGHTKYSLRLSASYSISKSLKFSNRFEVNRYNIDYKTATYGFLLFHDIIYKSKQNNYSGALRLSYFQALNWNNRIYATERDAISTFYSPVNYGKGFKAYLNLRLASFRFVDILGKYSIVYYFDRDKIGEGPDQSQGPSRDDFRIQLKIRF